MSLPSHNAAPQHARLDFKVRVSYVSNEDRVVALESKLSPACLVPDSPHGA